MSGLLMPAAEPSNTIGETELARASVYGLLANLLAAAPDSEKLQRLAGLEADESAFGLSLGALAKAAEASDAALVEREYNRLFIGVGRGELVPFASFYLTGFLHEKPLAKLRGELKVLGVARAEGVAEPEDHIAALCEVMAGLIRGDLAKASLARQKGFFARHLGNWAPRLFADMESAKSARFYRAVGQLGGTLMAVEAEGFEFVGNAEAALDPFG